MPRFKRKQLFVDPAVQGAFVLRAMLYWVLCLVTVLLMLLFTSMLAEPARLFYPNADSVWFRYAPASLTVLMLLPVIAYDTVRLSNRLAGPVLRLRRGMRALAEGEPVVPIHFREGDFWRDFADEFNAVAARLQYTQKRLAELEARQSAEHEVAVG
jgi:hypothetical protein